MAARRLPPAGRSGLADRGASPVSLPGGPLLGVLPGTGGLTRVVDKRLVRKDRADLFATKSEGYRGATAVDWGLIDGTVVRNGFDAEIAAPATRGAAPGGPGQRAAPADSRQPWSRVGPSRSKIPVSGRSSATLTYSEL